jgi:ABC-type nickel/cobalt efflux system permease component RcnA
MTTRLLRAAFAAAAALLALAPFALDRPEPALAHPVGNFSVNRYARLEIEAGRVYVRYVIDMAEVPAFQELQSIDRDRDGEAGPDEAAAYLERRLPEIAAGLDLRVGASRVPLSPLPGAALSFLEGQGGLRTLRLAGDLEGALPAGWESGAEVSFRDANYEGRIGWREIVLRAAPGVALDAPPAALRDISAELTTYPQDLLRSPPNVRQVSFSLAAGEGPALPAPPTSLGQSAERPYRSPGGFAGLIERRELTPAFVALSLLAAMAWGAAHALGPGHGKTIVGAYLVGSRGTARHALALGLTVTATHTSSVIALGLVTLYASRYVVAEDLYLWLGVCSGVLVIAMGALLLWTRLRAARRHGTGASLGHHHHHGGDGDHEHAHDDHGHHHAPPAPGWRGLVMLGVSGGLLPCPTAIVVMLGATALDRVVYGLVLIGAFSAGLAAVLTGIGLALVYAGRLFDAPRAGRLRAALSGNWMAARLVAAVPLLSAGAILAAGVVLTGQAVAAL